MKFQVKDGGLRELAKDLENGADIIAAAEYEAVNEVAGKAYRKGRREIVSRVNLTQKYVSENMGVFLATKAKPWAFVVARFRPTRLATYGARQVTAPSKRAKGDSLRRISRGRKQAGVSVAVKKGASRKVIKGAFLIPLRNSNGMGVFTRNGVGRRAIRHRYSLSVDQVFRAVIPGIMPSVSDELERAVLSRLEAKLKRTLKI